jgi:hypothetical protein
MSALQLTPLQERVFKAYDTDGVNTVEQTHTGPVCEGDTLLTFLLREAADAYDDAELRWMLERAVFQINDVIAQLKD